MRNNTDPVLVAGLHQHSCFRFTPVKTLKPAPRIWDRQLTTPLTSRGPRKLWKRILPARNDMKQPPRMAPAGQDHASDESDTEINGARDMSYFRGVKRRCIKLDDGVFEVSGNSFTETKWEFDTYMRKRKLPANATPSFDRQRPRLPGKSCLKIKVYEDKDTTATTTPAAVRGLTQEQESKLVRSALRSSLDDDDTALLNNFLSKAKAKRAAREAEAAQEEEEKATQETLESGYETPPRRALDKLDENSPSPTKQQFPPVNAEDVPTPEATEAPATPTTPTTPTPTAPIEPASNNETDEVQQPQDQQQPARPAARRNTRRRRSPPPLTPPSRTAPPAIRKSVSRANKEIEFILGDADDRDLFMRTRQNTFANMGVIMKPSDRLASMAREERRRRRHERAAKKLSKNQPPKEPATEEPVKSEEQEDKSTKSVTWKKKKFIEFNDGYYLNCYNDDSLTDATTETDNEFPNMTPFARAQQPKDRQEKDGSENERPPKVRRLKRAKKPLQ